MLMKDLFLESASSDIIDNENGIGVMPNNKEIDYFGIRVMMKPSVYLSVAAPGGILTTSLDHIRDKIREGAKIASPYLKIDLPGGWSKVNFSENARVVSHEGRNRMTVVLEDYGDVPVEVHVAFLYLRNRHITEEIFNELQKGIEQERTGNYVRNPFLKKL